jgi:hypothetical protein
MLILGLSVMLTMVLLVASRVRSNSRVADLGYMGDAWVAANRASRPHSS